MPDQPTAPRPRWETGPLAEQEAASWAKAFGEAGNAGGAAAPPPANQEELAAAYLAALAAGDHAAAERLSGLAAKPSGSQPPP